MNKKKCVSSFGTINAGLLLEGRSPRTKLYWIGCNICIAKYQSRITITANFQIPKNSSKVKGVHLSLTKGFKGGIFRRLFNGLNLLSDFKGFK